MTSKVINNLKTSTHGRDHIKGFEKLRLKVYRDQAGKPTIGWGHKLTKREIGKLVVITIEQAETIFDGDLALPEMYINATARVALTQNQFDALVGLTFNIGIGALDTSDLLRYVQNGNFQAAANEFDKWVHVTDPVTRRKIKSNGLIARRAVEKAMFLKVETGDVNDRS